MLLKASWCSLNSYRELLSALGDLSGDALMKRSGRFVGYGTLNMGAINNPDGRTVQEGTELKGFVSKTNDDEVTFALNAPPLTAVGDRNGALLKVQVGDVVDLRVTESSEHKLKVESDGFYDYRQERVRSLNPGQLPESRLHTRKNRQTSR